MKKIIKGMVPALLLTTLATPGFAENRQGSFNLSPFVGGYVLDDDLHEKDRPMFGLRAGYNFTKYLGIEGMFGYSLTDTKEHYGSRETDLYRYGGDILFHFMPDSDFVPFIAVGGGGISFDTDNTPSAPNHGAGLVSAGVGFKYFVSPNVALRADAREVMLLNSSDDLIFEYSGGLTFQFGGVKKAVVATAAPVAVAPAAAPVKAYAAADTTPPKVVFTSPIDGATAAPVKQNVNVAFSENMDTATLNPTTFSLKQGTTPVDGKVTASAATASFVPAKKLEKGKDYNATVTTGARDLAGNRLANEHNWKFTAYSEPKVVGVLTTLQNSHFNFDSAEISENGKTILKNNIVALKGKPDMELRIAGHTSAAGSEEYNQSLSERRAEAVKNYLVREGGINAARLSTIGYGEGKPVQHEANPDDKLSPAALANMRVVLEIIEEQ